MTRRQVRIRLPPETFGMKLTVVTELWKSQAQLRKAAAFYEKGGHFRDASSCFHENGEYELAIEALRRGNEFDELIRYIELYVIAPEIRHLYC